MKRGSIALARSLCYEIAGPTDEEDDFMGRNYGSVDIAEILSAEVERLRAAICRTLDANCHLADGEACTLLALKVALRESGAPWSGDEMEMKNEMPYFKGKEMTVADLIEFLQKQPQDLLVAYQLFSEQCLLDPDKIMIKELCRPRADGWIQNKRADMPTRQYLLFPGN